MTVVEDYSRQAKAEILAVLRERVRRMDQCLMSHNNLRRIIENRFGLRRHSAARIIFAIEDDLKERGILKKWGKNNSSGTIYSVNLD